MLLEPFFCSNQVCKWFLCASLHSTKEDYGTSPFEGLSQLKDARILQQKKRQSSGLTFHVCDCIVIVDRKSVV